ncbi:MAG: AI-2E family transporter [Coriobacteriia bacterium]|nr:AI-2E family transporter [Coriobacteriia bacterium]MCL2537375.1 AI-2E family transporter [Coriobacteriia bacterium]
MVDKPQVNRPQVDKPPADPQNNRVATDLRDRSDRGADHEDHGVPLKSQVQYRDNDPRLKIEETPVRDVRGRARANAQAFLESFGVPRWLVAGGLTFLMLILWGVGIAGGLYLFNWSSAISIPLLLAVVVAVVAFPLVKWFDKLHLPRIISSILVIFLILGLGYGTVHVTITGVVNQAPAIGRQLSSGATDLMNYTRDGLISIGLPERTIDSYVEQVSDSISQIFTGAADSGILGTDTSPDPIDPADNGSVTATATAAAGTDTSALTDYAVGAGAGTGINNIGQSIMQGAGTIGRLLTGLAGALFSTFIFLVFLFYFLNDFERIRDWISERMFKDKRLGKSVISDVTYSLSGYFRATTLTAVIVSISIGIPLWIMGVPLIIPIIIVTILTTYVPFLGAMIASAFTVLIALAAGGLYYALIAIVVMLIANNVLQTFVSNKLMGDYLNLHPLAVLIATLFGTVALGLLGGALGAPFLAIGIAVYLRVKKYHSGELTEKDLEERVHKNDELKALAAPFKKIFKRA